MTTGIPSLTDLLSKWKEGNSKAWTGGGSVLYQTPSLEYLYFLISRGGGEGKEKKDFEETGRLRALQDLIFLSQPWGKWKSWTKPASTR